MKTTTINKGKSSSNDASNNDAKALFGFNDTICHNCGVSNDDIGGFLLQCATCKKAYYCGMKCFNMSLSIHSKFCMTNELEKEPMGRYEYDGKITARIGPMDKATTQRPEAPSKTKKSKKKKQTVAASTTTEQKKKLVKKISYYVSSSASESETESESDSESKPVRQSKQVSAKPTRAPGRAAQCGETMDTGGSKDKDLLCYNELNHYAICSESVSTQVTDGAVAVKSSEVTFDDVESTPIHRDVNDQSYQNDEFEGTELQCGESSHADSFTFATDCPDDVSYTGNDNPSPEPTTFDHNGVADHITDMYCPGGDISTDYDKDESIDAHSKKYIGDLDESEETTRRSFPGGAKSDDARQEDISNDVDANPITMTTVESDHDAEETRKRRGGGRCSLPDGASQAVTKGDLRPTRPVPWRQLVLSEKPEWATMQLRGICPMKCIADTTAADSKLFKYQDPELGQLRYRYTTESDVDLADLHIRAQRSSSFTVVRNGKQRRKSSMMSTDMLEACRMVVLEEETGSLRDANMDKKAENECTLDRTNEAELHGLSFTGGSLHHRSMVDLSMKQRFESLILRDTTTHHQTKWNAEGTQPEWVNCHLRATQHGTSIKTLGEILGTAHKIVPCTVEPDWALQRRRLRGTRQPRHHEIAEVNRTSPTEAKYTFVDNVGVPSTKRRSLRKYQSCQCLDSSSSKSTPLPEFVRRAQMLRKARSATNRKQSPNNSIAIELLSLEDKVDARQIYPW